MTKIAVLISGEYRTFGLCRKTMKFLDDPRVDIYFSTWDKTVYDMPKLNLHREETVTLEQIQKDLGKDAVIEIEPHDLIDERRYNSKMIHRWKRGFELIKNSNIVYDYVLVMRPDLFFDEHADHSFNFLEKYTDSLASGWANALDTGFLNDVIFFSSYTKINELFASLSVGHWVVAQNSDWHTWWYSYTVKHFTEIKNFTEMGRCTFCRCWANENHKFLDISRIQEDWSDIRVLHLIDLTSESVIRERWPAEVVSRAQNKWTSGVYKKYKGKTALIISGMLRNYDTALLSMGIWGECDKFLVTWESAGAELINDYSTKVALKGTYVIPDNEFEQVYKEPCKNGNNTFRMVYLWEMAYKNVPKEYDRYIVIRPDGFYWTRNINKVRDLIHKVGPFKVNQTRNRHTTGITDQLLVFEPSHFSKLKNCYTDLVNTALNMIAKGTATNSQGYYLNPHELLYNLWNQHIDESLVNTQYDVCSSELDSAIELLLVRNTFVPFKTDKYDIELYKAVFYDTAAAWRRSAGCNYHGTFNRLLND